MKKKEGFYGWTALCAAALSFFCVSGVMNSFGAFMPALASDMGWKRGEISVAAALVGILGTLSMPLAGIFIGRYGARIAILAGNILIVLALFCLAFQSKYWQLLTAYAVIGLGMGIGGLIAVTAISSNWFIKKSSLAMGIATGSGNAGGLVLVPAIMALINRVGWRSAYMALCGFILLFAAIVPVLLVRNKPEDLGQTPDGLPLSDGIAAPESASRGRTFHTSVSFTVKEALKTQPFWLITVFGCAALYIALFFVTHQIAFLTGLGLSSETAALSVGIGSGVHLIGTFGMGLLGLRYDLKNLAVGAAGLLFVAAVVSFFTQSAFLAFTFSILLGIGIGACFLTVMTLMPAYFGRANFPKIMGLSMLFNIVATTGAPIGGFLYDMTKSYRPSLAIAIVVAAIGIVCALMLKPPLHPSLNVDGGGQLEAKKGTEVTIG